MTVGTDRKMRAKKVEQTQFQFRRKGAGLQGEVLIRVGAWADGMSAKREARGGELGSEPEFGPSGYKVPLEAFLALSTRQAFQVPRTESRLDTRFWDCVPRR